jgi:hypothetical protein
MGAKLIWCIGLYASASTWAFNVVRLVHAVAEPPVRAQTHFFADRVDFAALAAPGTHIVKSHEIDDAASVEELGKRAERFVITVRDPRDAVASLMTYHGHEFERALGHVDKAMRLCVRYAADPRGQVFYYESKFYENETMPDILAAHVGVTLGGGMGAKIFKALRREEVESYIATLPGRPGVLQDRKSGDRLDPQTHWHTHHAGRTGQIGRWQSGLTPEQAQAVQARLRDCFKFHAEA